MKLFHWEYCECNRAYSTGDIIVMATTVERARKKAYAYAKNRAKSLYRDMESIRGSKDPDDIADFEEKMRLVQADLAKEPKVIPHYDAIFINGSE